MSDTRFIADAMLGKLTRWLRVMGIDVVYDASLDDDRLLRCAEAEGRVLLTRDRRLLQRRTTAHRLLIASDYYHEQVRQVVETFGLMPALRPLSRCLDCNTMLRPVAREAIAERLPPYIYATHQTFKYCPVCDRIYWGGTHRANMLRQLQTMLGAAPPMPSQVC